MTTEPSISFLIPWCERAELALTLAANEPVFGGRDSEVIVINCGGSPETLSDLVADSGVTGVRQLNISKRSFNKALALNIGLSCAGKSAVFILDADVILLSDAFVETVAELNDHCFVTIEWVCESHRDYASQGLVDSLALVNRFTTRLVTTELLELSFRNHTTIRHQLSRRDAWENARAGQGLLLAKRSDLLTIGGYNSLLEGWGWEDDDVIVRLQHSLGLVRSQKGVALHLSHSDDSRTRSGEDRHQSERKNFVVCCRNYNNDVFAGTYNSDVGTEQHDFIDHPAKSAPPVADQSCVPLEGVTNHVPSFSKAVLYCDNNHGKQIGDCSKVRWSSRVTSLDQLLIEATVAREISPDSVLLHLDIGNSGFARRFASRVRSIDGVTHSHDESVMAATLSLPNYSVVVCNKYSETLLRLLPHCTYDVIVDNNIASFACCQFHLKALMKHYWHALGRGGVLYTAKQGMEWSAGDDCWRLTEADLVYLANEAGLSVTNLGHSVYAIKRR